MKLKSSSDDPMQGKYFLQKSSGHNMVSQYKEFKC